MCVVQLELNSESVFAGTEPDKQMRCCACEIFISTENENGKKNTFIYKQDI